MKKIILSVLALGAFTVASAQETRFGAKAGLNLANLAGDAEDTNMKVGFHVGAFAEIMVSDKFAVQPELLFSMQGAKEEYNDDFGGFNVSYEDNLKLTYLNIPIMAKYYVTEDFNIQAGPQIGFLLSAKVDSEASFEGETESEETDIKDFTESVDFGLNVGLGYNLTENLDLTARYNIGLSNIYKDSDDFTVTNSVIQISIGYKF